MTKQNCDCKKVTIYEGEFGEIFSVFNEEKLDMSLSSCECTECPGDDIEPIKIKSYTMINANGIEVKLITWGATIVSIKCPDKDGNAADIVLGFDNMQSYLDPSLNKFIGCVLGRCANRIMNATFRIRNEDYFITKNDSDTHHLHGGLNGFGRRVWESYVEDESFVVMSFLSEDGEEGYPGSVLTTVKFCLMNNNCLEINMRASTSKPTVVNLSHGSYFNLAGHDAGKEELMEHEISLNCDRWTFTDCENPIPVGRIQDVGNTVMDLRIPRLLKDAIPKVPLGRGFDHNFCVIRSTQPQLTLVSRIFHAKSGRFVEIYSDQPGVHLYTGGRLPPFDNTDSEICRSFHESSCTSCKCSSCDCVTESSKSQSSANESSGNVSVFLPGKNGARYTQFCAVSVQPQNYPNAVNVKNFPCAILRPGQVYYHDLTYKFGAQIDSHT